MLKCSKSDCLISSTGLCHEGINPPNECPHSFEDKVQTTAEESELSLEIVGGNVPNPLVIDLPAGSTPLSAQQSIGRGRELTEAEADLLLSESPGVVVTLVGMLKCGKTTMLAELFTALRNAPLGDLYFGGSSTLIAFDERCFKARLDSGNTTPHTPRTSEMSLDNPYLHLDLCRPGQVGERHRLILADVTGETYEAAASQNAVVETLSFVRRANHLVIMFDGARLADYRERATVKRVMLNLLYRVRDTSMLQGKVTLHLVFTKWDQILEKGADTKTIELTEEIESIITEEFAASVGQIIRHQLASRTSNTHVANRFGLAQLVASWCPQREAPVLPNSDALVSDDGREISKFREIKD